MLHFPKEYFDTEDRDGFAISELMKRSWAAQLEVLNKVIEVCNKYNLTYYVYWGTLLGAVRHQGYIPWDDDLDIAMKKDDYIKFLEVAQTEFAGELCIHNCYTDPDYDEVFTRITNGTSVDFSKERMMSYHNCPLVVGLDIFPLYYIPRNKADADVQKSILNSIGKTLNLLEETDVQNQQANSVALAEGLVGLEKLTGYRFTTDRPIKSQLYILYDQICQLFDESESDELTSFTIYFKCGYSVKKELLRESICLPFENLMVNAPKEYDTILRKTFGDYMVPRRVRAAHDYPFYREQIQILMNYLETHEKTKDISETDDEKRIEDIKGNKKIVLYHVSATELICNGGYAIKKMRYVFDIIRNTPEVIWWWYPCILNSMDLALVQEMSPELLHEYRRMTEEYKNENLGIYDESGDMKRAVSMADGYFGDEGELMKLFKATGKPIMLQDYEITK